MTVLLPCLGSSICICLFDRIVEASARNLGYQSLREEQTEAVKAFLGGRGVFVALPMDSGKSVCYTVLSVVVDNLRKELQMEVSAPSCILVVSPLVTRAHTHACTHTHTLTLNSVKSMKNRSIVKPTAMYKTCLTSCMVKRKYSDICAKMPRKLADTSSRGQRVMS